MKNLMDFGNSFIKEEMKVTDFAILKACLISLGILLGLCVPKNSNVTRGIVAGTAGMAFGTTLGFFMNKIVRKVRKNINQYR